jgi:hypothetical protein
MRLLLDLEFDISGYQTGFLVTFPRKRYLMPIRDALVNWHLDFFPIWHDLGCSTDAAFILVSYDLSGTVAVGALGLETLDHGSHLTHHRLSPGTLTARASLHSTRLTSTTLAGRTNDCSLHTELRDFAVIYILERYLVGMVDWVCFSGLLPATSATEHAAQTTSSKELSKYVRGIQAGRATALLR